MPFFRQAHVQMPMFMADLHLTNSGLKIILSVPYYEAAPALKAGDTAFAQIQYQGSSKGYIFLEDENNRPIHKY